MKLTIRISLADKPYEYISSFDKQKTIKIEQNSAQNMQAIYRQPLTIVTYNMSRWNNDERALKTRSFQKVVQLTKKLKTTWKKTLKS